MKKILLVLAMIIATDAVITNASAQPPHAKAWGKRAKQPDWKRGHYYYYPAANVYYSPVVRRYWYPRNGAWVNTAVLPPSVVVYNRPSYVVYREHDDDIWRDNRVHYRRYYRPVPAMVERTRPRSGVTVDVHARF